MQSLHPASGLVVPQATSAHVQAPARARVSSGQALSERAMLVSLHITSWAASKFDARITAEVAEQHSADRDAGRYTKKLVPRSFSQYSAVKTAEGAMRSQHRHMTLPWSEDGSRVLPVLNYEEYVQTMTALRSAHSEVVDLFMAAYPDLRAAAPARLGDMYRDEDWPDTWEVRAKFSADWGIMPLPDAGDFRVRLADEDAVRASIQASVEATTGQAMTDVWRRLYDATTHMAARLAGAGNCECSACGGRPVGSDRLNESAIENLRSLCSLLPRLNLTGDDRLTTATGRLEDMLRGVNVEDLRASRELRDRLAEQASQESARVSEVAPPEATAVVRRRIRSLVVPFGPADVIAPSPAPDPSPAPPAEVISEAPTVRPAVFSADYGDDVEGARRAAGQVPVQEYDPEIAAQQEEDDFNVPF